MKTNEMNTNAGPQRRGLKFSVMLMLSALLLSTGTPIFAQTDYDEKIRALEKELDEIKVSARDGEDTKARVEALEDELAKLKQQIADGASGQQSPGVEPSYPAPGVQGSPNPLRIDKQYLTGQDLLDESFPNSFPIPGSKVRVAFGGYAKLDFIQDLDYVGDRYEFYLPSIPVSGTPESELDGLTTLHAKETRFNVDFRSKAKTKDGREYPLRAFLEIDFFDDRETFALQPRLRHAYGVIGRLLAGQTWSTSADLEAAPGTIDFAAGDAVYGDRLAQIRWADRAGEAVTWAVALEENKADIGNPLGFDGANRPETPNLAGRVRWMINRSHVQLGGDVFQLNWQGGATGPSDTTVGWGLNLTGRALLGKNSNNALVGGVAFGDGMAHKIVSLRGSGSDAVITSNGSLETLNARQAYGGYSHYWTRSLNSTFTAAWTEVDNADIQLGDAINGAESAHVNLIWFPYKLVSTGIEYMWGQRKNKDGAKGTANRIQYMVKFKFN